MEKVLPARKVTRLPELTFASQLFIHFLAKAGERADLENQSVCDRFLRQSQHVLDN